MSSRIPYGDEINVEAPDGTELYVPRANKHCPDCGVEGGEYHELGCDVEQCPVCGRQFIGCEHTDAVLNIQDWYGASFTAQPGWAEVFRLAFDATDYELKQYPEGILEISVWDPERNVDADISIGKDSDLYADLREHFTEETTDG